MYYSTYTCIYGHAMFLQLNLYTFIESIENRSSFVQHVHSFNLSRYYLEPIRAHYQTQSQSKKTFIGGRKKENRWAYNSNIGKV